LDVHEVGNCKLLMLTKDGGHEVCWVEEVWFRNGSLFPWCFKFLVLWLTGHFDTWGQLLVT